MKKLTMAICILLAFSFLSCAVPAARNPVHEEPLGKKYEIVIEPRGKTIAEIETLYCDLSPDSEVVPEDRLVKGTDGTFHTTIVLVPGKEVILNIQGFEVGYSEITEMAAVTVTVPESPDKPILLKPDMVSYGMIEIVKPSKSPLPDNRLHFSVSQIDEDGNKTVLDVDGAVPTWSTSRSFYIKPGRHRFSSRQYIAAETDPDTVAEVDFEIKPCEKIRISSIFDSTPAYAEVVRDE